MRQFDTKVQYIKYKAIKEMARLAWEDKLFDNILDVPKIIVPGKVPTMRCCVYKERAILAERVKLNIQKKQDTKNIINVIDIACDDCPASGYEVTSSCRGCLAHRCFEACKMGAISFDQHHQAHIDKTKCVECGACSKVCPYTAIINRKRPCQIACKVKAISINSDDSAVVDDSKCTQCGACVYQCPFGAITDKSYVLDVIDLIKQSQNNEKYKVYAVVAPAIAGQFVYAKTGQIITAIKRLGFHSVFEAALGADMVSYSESQELHDKGFLLSSCCPTFVALVKQQFPELEQYISHNLSPMASVAKYIKEKDPTCKIVFIGPCTAKKQEIKLDTVEPYIDSAITFEELLAMIDSRDIIEEELPETPLDNASFFGRIYARSGGLTEAIRQGLKEHGYTDFEFKPCTCDGIEACKTALLKKSKGLLDANFVEGMACVGGCIGGAGCLTHGLSNSAKIDMYGKQATNQTITGAVSEENLNNI